MSDDISMHPTLLSTRPVPALLVLAGKIPRARLGLRIMRLCKDIPGIEFQRTEPVPI